MGNVGCYSRCSGKSLEGFKELEMCSDLHFQTSPPAVVGRVGGGKTEAETSREAAARV